MSCLIEHWWAPSPFGGLRCWSRLLYCRSLQLVLRQAGANIHVNRGVEAGRAECDRVARLDDIDSIDKVGPAFVGLKGSRKGSKPMDGFGSFFCFL